MPVILPRASCHEGTSVHGACAIAEGEVPQWQRYAECMGEVGPGVASAACKGGLHLQGAVRLQPHTSTGVSAKGDCVTMDMARGH